MKRFEIITEADARLLPAGEAVLLARGGHVTPLAHDTLKQKRIAVQREGMVPADEAWPMPPAAVRTLAVASDHTGLELRRDLVAFLRGRGLSVLDLGSETSDPVDYPDIAALVAERVARGEADSGIVIDGAGIGSAIAANKIRGIRAAMADSEAIARYAREHNGVNVLTLGASLVSREDARRIVAAWLDARLREPRYVRRLAKIHALEGQ
jgi:ribose 5-phosphate isomerase B